MSNGKPKPAFYLVTLLVVGGLIYYGINRFGGTGLFNKGDSSGNISQDEMAKLQGGKGPEAPDNATATTVKEYAFVSSQKLPEVKGTSAYQPLDQGNTVRMALNVWAGWAPVI